MYDSNYEFLKDILKYLNFYSYKNFCYTDPSFAMVGKKFFPKFLKLKTTNEKLYINAEHWSQLKDHPLINKLKLSSIGTFSPHDIKLCFDGYIYKDIYYIINEFNLTGTFKVLSKMNNNISNVYNISIKSSFKNGKLNGLYQRTISKYEDELFISDTYMTGYTNGKITNIDIYFSKECINVNKYKNNKSKHYFYTYPRQYTDPQLFLNSFPEMKSPYWCQKKIFVEKLLSNSYKDFNRIL